MLLLRRRAVARAVPMGQHSYPPAAELARADPMDQHSYLLAPGRSCPAAFNHAQTSKLADFVIASQREPATHSA